MIAIESPTAGDAWSHAMLELLDRGVAEPPNEFFRNDCAAFEIHSIQDGLHNDLFPMSGEEIESISRHLVDGHGDSPHDWTRLYRQRLFDGTTNYVAKIVSILREWPDCPRAQVTAWNNDIDHRRQSIAPCLQVLWFKILDESLHLHVHMRTSDCYGKLLMNFNEFMAVQKAVAVELSIEPGT